MSRNAPPKGECCVTSKKWLQGRLTFNVNALKWTLHIWVVIWCEAAYLLLASPADVLRSTKEFKSVGSFPAILVKLASSPHPSPSLNFEQNRWKWVHLGSQHCPGGVGDGEMNPKPIQKLSLEAEFYLTITWKGFSTITRVLFTSTEGGTDWLFFMCRDAAMMREKQKKAAEKQGTEGGAKKWHKLWSSFHNILWEQSSIIFF